MQMETLARNMQMILNFSRARFKLIPCLLGLQRLNIWIGCALLLLKSLPELLWSCCFAMQISLHSSVGFACGLLMVLSEHVLCRTVKSVSGAPREQLRHQVPV